MSRKFLIPFLAAAFLAAPAVPATAQKPGDPKTNAATVNASKSNTFKVTAVNASAATFTAISKDDKQFTFIAPKDALPTVGKILTSPTRKVPVAARCRRQP
jgi:hypothetical protein